jgi:hypothetical protein
MPCDGTTNLRYREVHSGKKEKDFSQATALYHKAFHVLPTNGDPLNQLAVLSNAQGRTCDAVSSNRSPWTRAR